MEYSQYLVFLSVVAGASRSYGGGVNVGYYRRQWFENDTRTPVDIRDHPYIVDVDGCAGTIVDAQWILTGAHCAYDKNAGYRHRPIKSVRVGSHIGDEGRRVEVEANIEHPNFDVYNSIKYDFLLLRLSRPLKLGNRVGLSRLASSLPNDLTPGVTGVTFGFGHTRDEFEHAAMSSPVRLTSEKVTVISLEECRRSFHDVDLYGMVVCAKPAVNHCDESGGPLIIDGVVIGVASTVAEHECSPADPIAFATVPLIRNWIRYNTKYYDYYTSTTETPFDLEESIYHEYDF